MPRWKALLPPLAIVLSLAAVFSIHRARRFADTAPEFVEKYSAAYRRGDVEAILAMRYDLRLVDVAKLPPAFREELDAYREDEEREQLEQELERHGMWAQANSGMTYVSEKEHGDHIHVEVEVAGAARSEIVLVRRDGHLLVHPRPSWVDGR